MADFGDSFVPSADTLTALNMMSAIDPARFRALTLAAAVETLAYVKPYPPAPANSSYVRGYDPRSENLGHSWTVVARGPDEAVIGTSVSYSRWVKDEDMQTDVMSDIGWTTIQDDVIRAGPDVAESIDRQVRRWLGLG